jgi:hypothetical protein
MPFNVLLSVAVLIIGVVLQRFFRWYFAYRALLKHLPNIEGPWLGTLLRYFNAKSHDQCADLEKHGPVFRATLLSMQVLPKLCFLPIFC